VNKDLKKFIISLIASIVVAFAISYSYSAYQSYQREEKIDEVKKIFGFGESNKITSEVEENTNSQEAWQNQMLEMLELLGYSKVDTRPFYKRLYDKIGESAVVKVVYKTDCGIVCKVSKKSLLDNKI